ncbi:MAG TPA: hypothetical protein VIW73_09135 [Candidatus Cybelea sp.]
MLLFSSGTFTVDGITVFPDHADPNQFWYLPGPVGLESEANSSEPQFLLIMYAPDVAGAGIQGVGFLNVTLDLKVSADTQAKIVGQIRTQFPNVSDPRLAPVPFDEGTVQIVALNLQGSGGTSAAPGTASAVQGILGASNPELFGNNDALFALTLTEEGATILEQAFADGMTPVGGIYNLKFTGVLPALDVKITADLKRAYQSFSVDLTASAYCFSAGIDATFEKLRQDGVIKIEVVKLSTDASVEQQEQWALNLFKDQIMSQWFTPSLGPTTAAAADAQSVTIPGRAPATSGTSSASASSPARSTMGSQTPASASSSMSSRGTSSSMSGGGASSSMSGGSASSSMSGGSTATAPRPATTPPTTPTTPTTTPPRPATTPPATTPPAAPAPSPGSQIAKAAGTAAAASQSASPFAVALRLKYVQQDELKTVEIEFNEMSAVQRVYSPQGFFGLMLQGIDQSKHFLKVSGTDPFFNQFSVTINPPRDFTGIGLASAHVALDYGDPATTQNPKHGEFVFDAAHQTQQLWDVFQGLISSTSYTYTPDYAFDPESGWVGERLEYTLPPVSTENRLLTLDPYDFLGFLTLTLMPGRIDPNVVDRVEVPLQYTAKSGWQTAQTFIVRPGSPAQTWKLRLADKDDNRYTYSTNTFLKDGTLISTPSTTSTANAIIVSDPFAGAIDLTFQPAFDSNAVKIAIVEFSYQDPANNYSFVKTFQLSPALPVQLHVPIIDRTKNQYQYRVSLVSSNNQQTQGSYITASDPLVLVGTSP